MTVFVEPSGSTTDSFLSIEVVVVVDIESMLRARGGKRDPKCCLFFGSVFLGIFPRRRRRPRLPLLSPLLE